MTERIQALTVALDHDIREDDVQPIMNAIAQLRGVGAVTTSVTTIDAYVARTRARQELISKVLELLEKSSAEALK